RWLKAMLWVFAAVAALLWLASLTVNRPTLFPSGPTFEDVLVYKGRFSLYHTAKFFTSRAYSSFAYPAGSAPLYEALYGTADAVSTYLIVSCSLIAVGLGGAVLFLKKRGAVALVLPLLLLSFPMVFLVQRGNIEVVLWALVALGLVVYRRGWTVAAAILFGLAAAMKLYPILLLGLFLKRKRDVPALVIGVVTALAATGAAIAYTGPTFAVAANGFFTGVSRFQSHYVDVVSKVEVGFDHCLFSPLKYYAYLHHLSPAPWKPAYFAIAGVVTLLLFLRVRTLPFLNRVLFLVTAMVSLPPVSFTYTLVHLYVPLLFLMGCFVTFKGRPPATAVLALTLICFLMLPLAGLTAFDAKLPIGPIQACALLLLLLCCAMQGWPEVAIKGDVGR
ncbi:MAG: glycosyltransferase family 87 protein, partial [Bryocella sp.]